MLDPLLSAILQCDMKTAELLMKNGKHFSPEWYLDTLVRFTFWKEDNSMDIIKLLIKYGFDTGFHNSLGENLLNIFINYFLGRHIHENALEIAEFLIDSNLTVHEPDHKGFTPFLRCLEWKYLPFLK